MNIQTLTEKYLDGSLTPQEVNAFEERLKTDSALSEELRLQKDMKAYLLNKEKKEAFSKKIDHFGDTFFSETQNEEIKVIPIKPKKKFTWLIAAASAAAIALAIYFLMPQQGLYEQYAQHQPLQLIQKGDSQPAQVAEVENAFNQGQYVLALGPLQSLISQQPDNLEYQVIKSICLIETNQLIEARNLLTPISQGQSAYQSEALWYLALSYIKENQTQNARGILEQISTNDTFWYQKATKLLRQTK